MYLFLFKYLKKQQDLLTVKRQGFVHDGVDGTAEYKYLLLILKQIEGMLPTDRTWIISDGRVQKQLVFGVISL